MWYVFFFIFDLCFEIENKFFMIRRNVSLQLSDNFFLYKPKLKIMDNVILLNICASMIINKSYFNKFHFFKSIAVENLWNIQYFIINEIGKKSTIKFFKMKIEIKQHWFVIFYDCNTRMCSSQIDSNGNHFSIF